MVRFGAKRLATASLFILPQSGVVSGASREAFHTFPKQQLTFFYCHISISIHRDLLSHTTFITSSFRLRGNLHQRSTGHLDSQSKLHFSVETTYEIKLIGLTILTYIIRYSLTHIRANFPYFS